VLACLSLALYHDVEEIFTGDIPGPAKRILVKEEGYDNHIVPHVKMTIPSYVTKGEFSTLVLLVVKMASLVDEAMWMATDMQLGNASLNLPMHNTRGRIYETLGKIFELATTNGWTGWPQKDRDALWAEILNDVNRAQTGDSRILLG